ncbi:amino acid adenylation domain-containing protein [Nocardia abscessus]|uniref:amino acid adenylation domain-containing protein n=1 Tax=Nocardia abscessus TaxID=120957 RepID=UPI00313BB47E
MGSGGVWGHRTSTYRELDLLSERLARRLMKRGVDIDTVVAVLLPPSIDLIATIIAIWKAGGAYLPLAPDLPTERIRYQLDNARAHLAVVDSASARSLPCHVTPLFVDDLSPDGTPSKQLRDSVTDRRAAYVIYTSGSTGTPKGVVVEHRAVISFWHAMRAATENSTPSHAPRQVALNAAISFDASVQQLVTLLGGDTLHLLTDAVRRDDQQIVRYVREHQIDVLNATPTHLDTMIRAGLLEPGRHHPAQILVAGELLPSRLWPPLADADASTAYNIYGPTECTVNATATPIEVGLPFDTIGKPLPGYQVILVDAHLRPVPVGVPGEIMISGEAVARGYVGAAGLTARRFVANRFGLPGQRAYLTGDLGRWRADGHLEFLGRRDDQIKLRGFRIELDEVTQTVRSHTSVRDAATVLQNGEHDARLVAYYVPEPGTTPTVDALRTHVRTRLPEFMTPAHFVGLTALPVNSSGKLDRRALPPVVYEKPGERYAPPVTAVQEAIATAWESALGIDRAGIDDSFFEMGGDSIRGIRVRARAAELGVDFAVQDLFEHQTIRALSAAVSEGTALTGDPTTSNLDHPRIQAPSDVIDYHPLTATQAAMLFQSEYRRAWAPFTNVRTMHLRGRVDINRVESAVAELIAAHPALRSAFELIAYDEPMQLVHATATPSLRVEDIRALPPENQTLLINEFVAAERAKNFDWRVPPLMRFAIHHRSDDSFQLTVTMHEVIVDGWSVATVLVDLFRRYVGDDVRSPTALFRDHVGRERRALADRTHQDFWSGYLDGCVPAALAGGVDSDEHHVLVVELSEELAGRLRALARAASVPLKSVLLAAHIWVVATAAGSSEAVTGVVTNGRPEIIDGDRVVGQFLNTLPMRCSARHKMSWHEYVRTTFATEQKIWRYRRYPAIQAFRQGNGRALFDTAFNFTHFHIYDAIDGFESIDDDFFERTDLALLADFSVDQRSAAINLVLNTTGLTRQQAEQIAGEYQSTLEMMATTPDDPVRRSRADYRDPAEFIDRTDNPEPSVSFVELLRAQAERTPDAVAVSARGEALSYAAVRDEADRIARTLIRRGLGPEAVVAVAAPRSTDILVALIGVLTAGAAYLPLDTETPQSHNARIVALCEPNFLLRTRDLGLPVDIPSADIATLRRSQQSGDNPAPRTHPTNIAYVIPTSGSGGMPKAVAVTHAAMINHLLAKKRELDLAPDDVVAFLAKPTFDISIWQMLAPLLAGSRVVIPTSNAPECLLPVLASSRATVAQVTPSQLHVALDSKPDLPTLRQLISTGEELSPALAARWVRRFPNIQLINGYGPTECADNVTHHRVRGHGDRPVPLGTPIDRIAIHVLDHMLQPVRVGNVGQLAIAGPALARGYFGSPSDTASAFVADPRRTGARMYLTGDLVQTSHDGSIVFIGRTDRELKVNGIRFHPGQVESVLHEHPDVNRAVVTTTRGPGRRRTVAHVVVDGHRTHSRDMARDIRAHVGKRLPIVFVPNHVVFVEKIPMNEHGKLDIASLPLPAAADHARTPPATESERALLRLWHQTVGDEPIGVTADMFQAGLDSVYAMRFVVAARERLGLHIDLDALFATPTLAELAARVSLTESTSAAAAHTDDLPQPGE